MSRTTFDLHDRVAVITGASGGIGRAIARALAAEGTRLILCGRNARALQSLAGSLPLRSVESLVTGSLTSADVRTALADAAGRSNASMLVNVMGINNPCLFAEQDEQAIDALIETNLAAPLQVTHRLLPGLLARDDALIINIGSVFGTIGHPGYTTYCATKFGLRGFSEALKRELGDTTVRVLHVEPRATQTAMNDGAGRALNTALGNTEDSPETVAAAVLQAIRSNRRLLRIGWPERLFAVLNQIIPGVVDRSLEGRLATIKAGLAQS